MRIKTLVFVLCLCFSTQTLAQAGVDDPLCSKHNNTDIYETPTRIGQDSQSYSGDCVDTDRFRPAVIIEDNQNFIKFANYRHDNQYWIARLNKKAQVAKVYFQIVRFQAVSGVIAAHTQIRFVFTKNSALNLRSQEDQSQSQTQDLVISYEASRPAGVPYNFALGGIDNYLSVARILSGKQRLTESTQNKTEQYEIAIPKTERLSLILNGIKQSDKEKFSIFYNTLYPNCTTEAFNLIDSLPSLQQKNPEPFLTVISNNPVAKPSLEALKKRKIFIRRYANLKEDIEQGATQAPRGSSPTANIEFLADIPNLPYALVSVSDANASKRKALQQARSMAYKLAPRLAQSLGSSLMLAGTDSSFSLLRSLDQLSSLLKTELKKLNSDLNGPATQLSLYLVPWDGSGQEVDVLKELNVRARLPFKTYRTTYQKSQKIFDSLIKASQEQSKLQSPFALLGLATHLHLEKDNLSASLQVLGQLGPQTKIIEPIIETPEANLTTFKIPKRQYVSMKPMALMQVHQNINDKQADFSIHFGPLNALVSPNKSTPHRGFFSVNPSSCQKGAYSTPYLEGEISLLGLFKWKDTNFHITDIDFDLKKQEVKNVSVSVKPLSVVCLSDNKKAGKAFTDGLNDKLSDLKQKYRAQGESLGFSILEKILSNNPNKSIAGFE